MSGLEAGVRLKNAVVAYLATCEYPMLVAKHLGVGEGDDLKRRIANARTSLFCEDAPKRKDGCGGWHVDDILAPRCSKCEKYAWNRWKKKQERKQAK